MTDAHRFSSIPEKDPISVTLTDGNEVRLTHKCILDLPGLPEKTREGHVVPGLTSRSLISVVTLCNTGCKVTFTKVNVKVTYNGKVVLPGSKYDRTGLWMVPLNNKEQPAMTTETQASNFGGFATKLPPPMLTKPTEELNILHTASNMATTLDTSSKQELAQFHHQSLCSPPISTILNALTNNPVELLSFPGLSRRLITK